MGRFDGAWEETGVVGPRVEIKDNMLVRLWQASPVLETRFETVEDGGKIVLKLEHDGLRSAGSLDAYAVIKECYFNGTALVFVDDYRFSGESTVKMYPTKNSRYGNVTLINDEVFPLLQGRWVSRYTDLVFEGSTMSICGSGIQNADEVFEIVAARHNDYAKGDVMILNKDPAKHGFGSFSRLEYQNGELIASVDVCDAETMKVVFTKQ